MWMTSFLVHSPSTEVIRQLVLHQVSSLLNLCGYHVPAQPGHIRYKTLRGELSQDTLTNYRGPGGCFPQAEIKKVGPRYIDFSTQHETTL